MSDGRRWRIQAVYQSMLKRAWSFTNAVLDGITVKNRKKGRFVEYVIRWLRQRPCLNEDGECWYCWSVLGWERWKAYSVVIATPEEEQPFPKRTGTLAHHKHTLSSNRNSSLWVSLMPLTQDSVNTYSGPWQVLGNGDDFCEHRMGVVNGASRHCRTELMYGNLRSFEGSFPTVDKTYFIFTVRRRLRWAPLTIATTHQMLGDLYRAFDLVVIDETDSFPYRDNELLIRAVHRVWAWRLPAVFNGDPVPDAREKN